MTGSHPDPAGRRGHADEATIQLRVHGDAALPTLIYLPGLHGDWTLVSSFRAAVAGRVRFVEFTYPCRTDWTLEDYAHAVVEQLATHGINGGWILAESFGSQVAWKILELADKRFEPAGVIFAGGFVRHPVIWGVHGFYFAQRRLPWPCFRLLLKGYARYARFRHRQAPETLAAIDEFVRRRTRADNLAIASRYPLIARADFRDTARRATLPVFALAGFFDPIVAWPFVHPWLRKNCPGFRARRIILNADHNVLATTPKKSAEQVLRWMNVPDTGARTAESAHRWGETPSSQPSRAQRGERSEHHPREPRCSLRSRPDSESGQLGFDGVSPHRA